ncbi:LTA synthase family protein [Leucobacter musarum]|uniref:LTA synthase family protein n=1 Tax=Leucobacter musarum TaxID=1930747 RepID=UPI0006A7D96D|nr:LTA synthase family protein [Leucobacter musarum]
MSAVDTDDLVIAPPSIEPIEQQAEPPASPSRRRLWRGASIVAFWVLAAVSAAFVGIGFWVRRTFGAISIDQLLSNLNGGGEGAGGAGLVIGGVMTGIVIPLGIVLLVAIFVERRRRRWHRAAALGERPNLQRPVRWIAALLAVVLPVSGGAYLGAAIGAGDYAQALYRDLTTDFGFDRYYETPQVSAAPGAGSPEPRNLIVIYLESMENTFSDDDLFEKDMLAPVEDVTRGWQTIDDYRQYEGGGWTMSGILSTQCGVPLRSASSTADISELNEMDSADGKAAPYLAGATCLGDVLADQGYRNVYLGGADASFAGKGAFLSTHGYDEIDDLNVWKAEGETEVRGDWGLSDRRLFAQAKDKVDELHAGDQPFNLTMLSLDTHEGPRLYDYCTRDTDAVMTSITYCSMQQVAGFVEYLDQQGYLDDTAVVLMGDHQKMIAEGGSFWDELKDLDHRTIFNRIWSPDGLRVARDDLDQMSMYPTLLELTGLEVQDHRAGIGVSALTDGSDVPHGSILDLSAEEYRDLVTSRSSEFYQRLWRTSGLD